MNANSHENMNSYAYNDNNLIHCPHAGTTLIICGKTNSHSTGYDYLIIFVVTHNILSIFQSINK